MHATQTLLASVTMIDFARVLDDATPAFSGAVRVTVDGEVAFEAARGLADRQRGIANTVDTRFGIASGTKLVTALAVGALIDDGRLAMDASVMDIVSARLPNVSADVTIGHLLRHASGVYDYYDEEVIDDFDSFELAVPLAQLDRLEAYVPMLTAGPMKFAPGTRFSYSNGGYVLLGLAIEAAAGMPYHRFVADRVLGPAGMQASGFFRFDALPDAVAVGYADDGVTSADRLPVIGGADGGMFATVGDLDRLWAALLEHRLLSPALTATFLTPANHYKNDVHYGCGVWIRGDHHFIEGADAGVSFKSTCFAPGTVATVASNTSEGAWPVADAIDAAL